MLIVNINDTEMQLSELVDAAARGEEIILVRDSLPVVRLVRIPPPAGERKFGSMKGRIQIADDFDAPLPEEILSAFEGK